MKHATNNIHQIGKSFQKKSKRLRTANILGGKIKNKLKKIKLKLKSLVINSKI